MSNIKSLSEHPVICLMGPTASGKTALAVELAQRLPIQIVSVDSALVYKGMDIGTSKPDAATLAQAPHRLIDICEPTEIYSAARFRDDATNAIDDIYRQGAIPLLVGGTMLYFKALLEGLSEMPQADASIRQQLEQQIVAQGITELHAQLQKFDPVAAEKIHSNDKQRIMRAIEIYQLTGKPISHWWQEAKACALHRPVLKIGIWPKDRAVLHSRIEKRYDEMLAAGFEEEVKRLRETPGMHADLPSMRSVGYRQMWEYLQGETDYETMRHNGIVATRRLAKRQLTWLRAEEHLHWFDAISGLEDAFRYIQKL